jgi:hypothetical protein
MTVMVVAAACGGADHGESNITGVDDDVVVVPEDEALEAGRVVDEGGVVEEWEFAFTLSDADADQLMASAVAQDGDDAWLIREFSDWDLVLLWSALPCNTHPVLVVHGEGTLASLSVEAGPEVVIDAEPPMACESVEVRHAVYLRTSASVEDEVEVSRR